MPTAAAKPRPCGVAMLSTMSAPTTGNWPSTDLTISSLVFLSNMASITVTNTMRRGNREKNA